MSGPRMLLGRLQAHQRLLTFLLALMVAAQAIPASPLPVPLVAADTFTDPLTGTVYTDVPPQELLAGKSRADVSRILQQWQLLAPDVKDTYRAYIKCENDLTAANARLADAQAKKSTREEDYKAQSLLLKKILIAMLARLGLQTGVVGVDAATDLYLAGRSAQRSLEEAKTKNPEAEQMDGAVKRAAESRAAVQKLEQDLSNALLSRDLAKADAELAAGGRTPVVGSPAPGRYTTLELDSGWKLKDKSWGVTYLTPEQAQACCRLYLQDGRIFIRDPQTGALVPYSTENLPTGRAIYVMDAQGNLYAHPDEFQKFHHSSFLSGGPVAGAGEIMVDNGKPVWITRKSGHYHPTSQMFQATIDELKLRGVDTSKLEANMQKFSANFKGGLEDKALLWSDVTP